MHVRPTTQGASPVLRPIGGVPEKQECDIPDASMWRGKRALECDPCGRGAFRMGLSIAWMESRHIMNQEREGERLDPLSWCAVP